MLKRSMRPSPTTVIACLALFFAIAGGSAIALQGRNSVDSGDIKRNAVKNSDIANNAVKTGEIRNNHVRTADIQNGQVGEADVADAEAFHIVGAAGEPTLSNGGQGDCIWSPVTELAPGVPVHPAGFYKDPYGVVHLSGLLRRADGPGGDAACDGDDLADSIPFALPPEYRPAELVIFGNALTTDPSDLLFVTAAGDRTSGPITLPGGSVAGSSLAPGSTAISLDGITFRAVGTGGGVGRRDPGDSSGPAAIGDIADAFAELTR